MREAVIHHAPSLAGGPQTAAPVRVDEWRTLYRVGGFAALGVLLLMPIQVAVFILWPPPATVDGWFALFRTNAVVGLLDMDLLIVVDQVLLALVFLALYVALRRISPAFMTVALTLQLVAVTTYFASSAAFEMLALSGRYATATTEAERAIVAAAGQAMIATWQGTAFDVSYVLAAIAFLIVAVLMSRTHLFGKAAPYVGIVAGAAMLLPPTAGTVGLVLSLVSLPPLYVWLILVTRRLFQLDAT